MAQRGGRPQNQLVRNNVIDVITVGISQPKDARKGET